MVDLEVVLHPPCNSHVSVLFSGCNVTAPGSCSCPGWLLLREKLPFVLCLRGMKVSCCF